MSEYKEVKIKTNVRTKLVGELGKVWPEVPQVILTHYLKKAKDFGRANMHFQVDGLPMSLNHQYKKNGNRFYLDPKALDYRVRVCEALGQRRWAFKATGTFAAVIFLESKLWVTAKRQVRQMDADNRVKPILDAIEHAMDLPDELCWDIHVFKIAAKRDRTTVYLFDLGDIVEFYS